jgi:hypothetical protein
MTRRHKPVPTQHQFRHTLLDPLERFGVLKGDKLNEAHLRLGACFTRGDFHAAVEYAEGIGLTFQDVDRAWFGS